VVAEVVVALGAEHDHRVAPAHLGVGDAAVGAVVELHGLEAEGLLQPFVGGTGVAVAQ
jgi:hypothetical protein